MKNELKSVDNIDNEILDKLVKLYGKNKSIVIYDDRKTDSFGKPREYFLIRNKTFMDENQMEWSFIWIGNNLWQFSYCNIHCKTEGHWKNPVDLLNELLNAELK